MATRDIRSKNDHIRLSDHSFPLAVLATWQISSKKCLLAASSSTNKTAYGLV